MSDRCTCGSPLHYGDATALAHVQRGIDRWGATVRVPTPAGIYHVPRHYIALHGLKVADLPRLARRYGWVAEISGSLKKGEAQWQQSRSMRP